MELNEQVTKALQGMIDAFEYDGQTEGENNACYEAKQAIQKVKNITYEPLLGTGLCENCRVPKMTNSGNGVDEPTNPVLWCYKESFIIEPVPE